MKSSKQTKQLDESNIGAWLWAPFEPPLVPYKTNINDEIISQSFNLGDIVNHGTSSGSSSGAHILIRKIFYIRNLYQDISRNDPESATLDPEWNFIDPGKWGRPWSHRELNPRLMNDTAKAPSGRSPFEDHQISPICPLIPRGSPRVLFSGWRGEESSRGEFCCPNNPVSLSL